MRNVAKHFMVVSIPLPSQKIYLLVYSYLLILSIIVSPDPIGLEIHLGRDILNWTGTGIIFSINININIDINIDKK